MVTEIQLTNYLTPLVAALKCVECLNFHAIIAFIEDNLYFLSEIISTRAMVFCTLIACLY